MTTSASSVANGAPSARDYKRVFFELLGRRPHLSADRVLSAGQKWTVFLLVAALAQGVRTSDQI